MYKDDIKTIYKEKREALASFLGDSLTVLLKLYIFMPRHEKERKDFINIIKTYIKYHNEEKGVLSIIMKKYGKIDENETVDIILDELDELFEIIYGNYQDVLGYYEDMIITKDTCRVVVTKNKVLNLDSNLKRKYINELGGK